MGDCPLLIKVKDIKIAGNDHLYLAQWPGSHQKWGKVSINMLKVGPPVAESTQVPMATLTVEKNKRTGWFRKAK